MEKQKYKCYDCGKEDYETYFETITKEPLSLRQLGTSFSKCNNCDEMFCENCTSEHASFEIWS